jgi:hypothetical protein
MYSQFQKKTGKSSRKQHEQVQTYQKNQYYVGSGVNISPVESYDFMKQEQKPGM